jgi:hypothetical protein
MESVLLDKLFISEVSGVDDPANQLPGWMVTKASGEQPDAFLILAGEMEAVTKASDSKQPYGDVTYADPGYQKDGKKRYPLDTEEHIRAAWSYINQGDNASVYTAEQVASIKAKIKSAMKKIGATVESDTSKDASSESIVAKIKGILLGTPGEEGIEMEKQELLDALAERDEALVKAVAEAVSKSVAPAEGESVEETAAAPAAEAAPAPAAEAAPTLSVEDVTKAITEAIEEHVVKQYNEIFEKVIDRLEACESALGVAARKSLDGQESGEATEPVTKATPDLADAITAAFKR